MGMDTMAGNDPMENPPHTPLDGLDPADLLRQGVAEDTIMEDASPASSPTANAAAASKIITVMVSVFPTDILIKIWLSDGVVKSSRSRLAGRYKASLSERTANRSSSLRRTFMFHPEE